MKLVRVTQLEQFRKWHSGCFYVNEQSVIDSISGGFKGNNKTRIGTAGHKFVEVGSECLIRTDNEDKHKIEVEEVYFPTFSTDQLNILDWHREYNLPHAYHEQKYGKEFETKHGSIFVGGTIDVIHGITLRDTKFMFRTPDYSNYTESQQWKMYLEFTGLDVFYFDLFEFKGYKDELELDVSELAMVAHEPLECIRYKNMELDNKRLVEAFMDWVEYRNIKHLLMNKNDYFYE